MFRPSCLSWYRSPRHQRVCLLLSGSANHSPSHLLLSLCRGHSSCSLESHCDGLGACYDLGMKQRLIVEDLVSVVDLVVERSWVIETLT